jgi:hypothetical protein
MSKFLLNILVQISKALVYSKIQFYSKRNFPQISAHPALPRPRWPPSPRRPLDPGPAHSAQAALAYLPKGVFPSTLHIPAEMPSLSHVSAMWGPSPRRPTRWRFSASPPATLRHPASNLEMPSEVFTPALIPPFNPPLTPH